MTPPALWLVGGGGHCRSCIDVISAEGKLSIAGIVDRPEMRGSLVLGHAVSASDGDLAGLHAQGAAFLITVGQVRSAGVRLRIFGLLAALGAKLPVVVSPLARFCAGAEAGEGTIVMHHAVLNVGARVGRNCIVNTRTLIEHDAVVGDHCHVSTGAIVNGDARIGDGAMVGSGCVILQGVSVAPGTILGAGTVVVRDITDPGVYVGNPARKVGKA